MISRMTKRRPGYHDMLAQIPDVLWEKLCEDAEREEESATKVLIRILARHYKISREELPKPKKAGRPPKS